MVDPKYKPGLTLGELRNENAGTPVSGAAYVSAGTGLRNRYRYPTGLNPDSRGLGVRPHLAGDFATVVAIATAIGDLSDDDANVLAALSGAAPVPQRFFAYST